MTSPHKTYIAGIGMITSIGANAAMTFASVNAGISGYSISEYSNMQGYPITLASVPDEVFSTTNIETDTGNYYCKLYDRIIKMAIISIKEALSNHQLTHTIPLILTLPEDKDSNNYIPKELLIKNLIDKKNLPLQKDKIHCVTVGRSGGIQALEVAQHLLSDNNIEYVLVGGSDSYHSLARLYDLDDDERLLAPNRKDGFAPGEGAGFLLLTSNRKKAINYKSNIIALLPPGSSKENGHLYSTKTYKGDGLDKAFKLALLGCKESSVNSIFSSMNGENHWAKEYGVATMRNKKILADNFVTEHPADCYGDLGVASGSVLVAMSVLSLFKKQNDVSQLVYSSSDSEWRSAIRLEKLAYT